jgi:hypothetical protein
MGPESSILSQKGKKTYPNENRGILKLFSRLEDQELHHHPVHGTEQQGLHSFS